MHEGAERKISQVSDLTIARGCVLIRHRHVMMFAFAISASDTIDFICVWKSEANNA